MRGQLVAEQIVTCFYEAFLFKINYVHCLLGFFPPVMSASCSVAFSDSLNSSWAHLPLPGLDPHGMPCRVEIVFNYL